MPPRVLVAGIGNIFLGDDGFGVAVAQRLMQHMWPAQVRVADFGIRGFDLAFAILDGYDLTILIDALPRGGTPGTLYVLEPDVVAAPSPNGASSLDDAPSLGEAAIETHGMDPVQVLRLVQMFGALPGRLLVVGCEPGSFGPEGEGRLGLSAPVEASLDEALRLVESLVAEVCLAEPSV